MVWVIVGITYILSGVVAGYAAVDYSINNDWDCMADTVILGFLGILLGYMSLLIVLLILLAQHSRNDKLP